MDFQPHVERTWLLDPAGQRVEQVIEHRADPLTGTVASVNGALGEKGRAFLGSPDLEGLRDLEQRSRQGCPFCLAAERGTRFAPEFLPEGQLRMGRSVAMPNLFSKCAHDSVVVIDQGGHVLFPSRIAVDALATAVQAAAVLVRRVRERDRALVHHLAGMYFLHPGGSSVPHPHLQVHVRGVPYSGVSRLLVSARLIVTGGIVRPRELSMVGPIPAQVYDSLHVDKAFIGAAGISPENGLTEFNMEDAQVKQVLNRNARQHIVVADGSKFGQTTITSFAPLKAAHTIVTDRSAPADVLDSIRLQGVEVLVAD